MFECIYIGYMGVMKYIKRVCDILFWLKMFLDIEEMVFMCNICFEKCIINLKEFFMFYEVFECFW